MPVKPVLLRLACLFGLVSLLCALPALAAGREKPPVASASHLQVCPQNPHYLQSAEGKPLFLVGAYAVVNPHLGPKAWRNFVDAVAGRMNFMRLETPLTIDYPWPQPYVRVPGSGKTSNGIEGKFDLTKFNEAYWRNLRAFLKYAGKHGIVVQLDIFDEIFTKYKPGCCGFGRNAFGNGNHVNFDLVGNVDRNNDLCGTGPNEFYDVDALYGRTDDSHRLAVARLQRAWVAKFLVETSDLPNVFYEIGNELSAPTEWIEYWIDFIRARTQVPLCDGAGQPFEPRTNTTHPVECVSWHNAHLGAGDELVRAFGKSDYACGKVLIADTDGAPAGQCANPEANRQAAWLALVTGGGAWADYAEASGYWKTPWRITPKLDEEVRYFGYLLAFLKKTHVPFWQMRPHTELTSRGRCLAAPGKYYLVYSRFGGTYTLDLSGAKGKFNVQWYNPVNGTFAKRSTVQGGAKRTFTAPFAGEAALYVWKSEAP